jgi:hypothetical protein
MQRRNFAPCSVDSHSMSATRRIGAAQPGCWQAAVDAGGACCLLLPGASLLLPGRRLVAPAATSSTHERPVCFRIGGPIHGEPTEPRSSCAV